MDWSPQQLSLQVTINLLWKWDCPDWYSFRGTEASWVHTCTRPGRSRAQKNLEKERMKEIWDDRCRAFENRRECGGEKKREERLLTEGNVNASVNTGNWGWNWTLNQVNFFAVDTAFPNSLYGDLNNEMQNQLALEVQHNRFAQD